MKFSIFCILSLLMSWNISYGKEPEITCGESVPPMEIFKLLATVKNDILGTLPRFCRSKKYEQLSDQVDPGEKSLDEFVSALKKKKSTEKDAMILNEDNIDDVVHQAMKLIVLKKMWNGVNENDQYSLLLSDECGELGLNRFPYIKTMKNNKVRIGENKGLYIKVLNACSSVQMQTLAPFMTKEVLAEGLLNLKAVFPQSFPKIVDSLCGNLSELDELIFKEDVYSQFTIAGETNLSAEEFSSWLKDTYSHVDEVLEKLSARKQYKKYAETVKASFQSTAEGIADLYEKMKKEKNADGPFVIDGNPDYVILKKNGFATVELNPEKKEEILTEVNKLIDEKNNKDKLSSEEQATAAKEYLKEQYIKLNKDLEKEEDFVIPGAPGFSYTKNKKGEYEFKIDEATKKKIVKQTEVSLKILKPFANDSEIQKTLEEAYNLQEKYKDDQLMKTGEVIVHKDKKGAYYVVKRQTAYDEVLIDPFIPYFNKISGNKENDPMPLFGKKGALVKVDDDILYVDLEDDDKLPPDSNYTGKFLSGLNKGYTGKNAYFSYKIPLNKSYENTLIIDDKFVAADVFDFLSMAATNKFQSPDSFSHALLSLDATEKSALLGYTGADYSYINKCLRNSICTDAEKDKINKMVGALKKIAASNGETGEAKIIFRGVKDLPDSLVKDLQKSPEAYVLDKGFMSASGNIKVAKHFASLQYTFANGSSEENAPSFLFVIKAKSCQGISNLSSLSPEDEFLCPPGMKFNIKRHEASKSIFILEEVAD